MYVIKANGAVLYSPDLTSGEFKVIAPRMHLEINAAGSLGFVLPPCNSLYNDVHKMKSIITVEQDGEVVFRGRITEESVDSYKQRTIYCEGDLSFLLDSLQAPASFTGTQLDLFTQLITAHNAQMDEEKQFVLGDVSGLDNEEVFSFTSPAYSDTLTMVQNYLIDLFGGYIQTRTEGGVHYIDYVGGFTDECSQKIEFGVNLLNFESQINAQEFCSVLVPLGATGDDGAALTIASVNGGKVYIENPEAIERFGRVYKTYTWENVTDPAELLELGVEYMQGAGIPETLSITAVDMHLLDADVEKIRKGRMVHLRSKPHGLDKKIICASIDADLENGDQTVFGFGLPAQRLKTLAEQAAENEAGLGGLYTEVIGTQNNVQKVSGKVDEHHKWLTETETSLNIAIEHLDLIGHRVNQVEIDVDSAEAAITLKANQTSVDVLEERMSGAEVRIDGAEADIALKAAQSVVDELGQRLTGAEVRIDGAEAAISMKAAQSTVDSMGERLSTAELRIDGAESKIEAKADLILLDGYVKMEDFETVQGWATDFAGVTVSASVVVAGSGDFDELACGQFWIGGESVATQGWVEEQGYLKTIPDTYATTAWVDNQISGLNSVYATRDWVTGTATRGLATEAWVTENFSKASTTYMPTVIERYGDVSGTSIPVQALNESGTVLLTGTVDAGDVYNAGWNECRDACSDVEVYTISEYSPGTLYVKVGDNYSSAGSSWVKVTRKYGVYTLPSAKT